jgi:hypothetical protein
MEKFFLRFHPAEEALAREFAGQLPDRKISMAKLQEHLMKYRDDPKDAAARAKEVMQANDEAAEMTIAEWLYRVNATEFINKFTNLDCLFVCDIQDHLDQRDPTQLDPEKFKFKEEDLPLRLRMSTMIASTAEAKADFRYLTANAVRTIMAKFVKNTDLLEELVALVEDATITGFQLKDIMRANYNFDQIKAAIEK